MGLSLHPARLERYKGVARLLFKYGRTGLVARAGLDNARTGEELPSGAGAPAPRELAADLERLYPGFAMVFFLIAAGGGIWLALNILSSDRPARTR